MVKTVLKPSSTHGIGLFAAEFIPKGTVTWEFTPGFDLIIKNEDLSRLSQAAREAFWNYCYVDKYNGHSILCFDNERFINHSTEPNITQSRDKGHVEGQEIAGRDIQVGEELTVNYFDFDKDAERKLSGAPIPSL